MMLDQLGWRHVVSNATKKHCPPFKSGDESTKVWYSKPCATALSRHYLLALLHGSWEVKHCRSSSYYAALLNGGHLPEQRAGRAGKMKFVAQNEDDLEAGASPPKPPKTKREARPAKKLDDACSDSEAFEAPGSPSACSSSSDSSSSDSRSSSSDSSSSSSSKSKKSDSPPDAPQPRPEMPEREELDRGDAGLNTFTLVFDNGVHIGWEMNCHHPLHQKPPHRCRVNRRNCKR